MKTISLFVLFGFLALTYLQGQNQKSTSQNLLPIDSKEKFDQTVFYFKELQEKRNSNYIFWEKSLIKVFVEAENWARTNGTEDDILQAQFMSLMYYENYLQNEKAIKTAEELIASPEFLKTKNAVYAYQALYNSYERLGFYRQQLEILDQLIELNKKYNYPVRPKTYQSYYDLGKIYYNLEQYELARVNFKKQGEIFNTSKDFVRTASMYNNIALTYKQEQQNDSALLYFDEALETLQKQTKKDSFYTAEYLLHFKNVINSNIEGLNVKMGRYSNAEMAFKNELKSSKEVKELRTARDAYHKLANYYFKIEEFEKAKIYNDSTFLFEQNLPSGQTKADALLLQTKLFIKEKNLDEALESLQLVFNVKDSLAKVSAEKAYSEATAKYNYVETQTKLSKNLEILQQKEKTNRILWVFMFSAVVAISIILVLLNKTKKSNLLISTQKNELAKGLIEKQNLLDEMHHRTKNNLQIVSGILELQSQKNIHPEANLLLKESQQYLESISIIHKMLYEQGNFEDVNLQTYLKHLAELIIGNYPRKDIELNINCQDVELPVNLITSLGLIVSELFTNSLKHAFGSNGEISIQHRIVEKQHQFEYRDNGVGFAEEKFNQKTGTGIRLIKSLSEDLEGQFEFKNNKGFHFKLKFSV